METGKASAERFYSMDALRASALLLGILFHAALSFTPYRLEVTPWAIYDPSPSNLLGAIAYVSHMFRMEVFFLIAGFFAHMVYHRKGMRAFLAIRSRRILLPFFVAWPVLYPSFIYMWVWGAMESGSPERLPMAPALAAWWRTIDIMFQPREFLFDRGFTLLHLWFLYYLFVLYVIVILLRKILLSMPGTADKIRRSIDTGLRASVTSRWVLFLVALPIAVAIYGMKDWYGVVTPERKPFPLPLIPMASSLFVYLIFFGAGWLLHRQADLLAQFPKRWKSNTLVGLVLGTSMSILFMEYLHVDSASVLRSSTWFRFAYCYLYGVVMLLLVFGVTGFFVKYFKKPSRTWRYLADSSYWLYLIHLPIVVWLQVALYRWDVHWTLKFALINGVAFSIMLLSYRYLVRSTFIGLILNGRKYPRSMIASPG
jgi:peptidoglycan/LPS O-acetylase OafA/YrhL